MSPKIQPTEEQQLVIDHEGSHALVSAVAGAGKSTTLVERIARLAQRGVDPRKIMAIQYNKSAQMEMQRKLQNRMQGMAIPQARTFHSIGYGMMKRLIDVGALAPARLETSNAAYDRHQRESLRHEWQRVHGRESYPTQQQSEGFNQFVTRAKADVRSAEEVFRNSDFGIECAPYIAAIHRMDAKAIERKICFFDDLLSRTFQTISDDPDLWSLFNGTYTHYVVDEFQDVNPVQYALLQGLVSTNAECMVVGDPDQSIYGFRGSDPDFIVKHFERDFTPCKRFKLQNTFRYGHETALAANHLITKNLERDDKITVALNSNADTRIHMLRQEPKKPSGLVQKLSAAHAEKRLRKQAVLVRYYSQSVPVEIELAEANIPFFVYGREPLLLVNEIAMLVGAMCLAEDYWVIPEILRVRYLAAMLSSPTIYAQKNVVEDISILMSRNLENSQPVASAIFDYAKRSDVNPKLAQRLNKRADVIRLFEAGGLRDKDPVKVIQAYLAFTDAKETMSRSAATPAQAIEAEQNVNAFTEMAGKFQRTKDLLDMLGPLAAHDAMTPPESDHLVVTSLHRAKGMEWDTVYLPGWSAKNFPRDHEPIEEERRLAYVAITRAIKNLVFLQPADKTLEDSIAAIHHRVGSKGAGEVLASPFLYEAEVGISRAGRLAIQNENPNHIESRRDDVVTRYMSESKNHHVTASVPESLRKSNLQTSELDGLTLVPGESRLRNGDALYTVIDTAGVSREYYTVRPLAGGDPRLISINEPGWYLA